MQPRAVETPITSNIRKGVGFKKFRDNTQRRLKLRKTRYNRKLFDGDTTSDSQRVTKKLLRGIRRRQLQNQDNSKKLQRRNMLRRKLNLTSNTTREIEPSTSHNVSLEEGEIISDDEVNKSLSIKVTNANMSAISDVDNDDDCVCIEPQIEQIVIDDDLPNTSCSKNTSRSNCKNNIIAGYVSIIQRINNRDSKLTGDLLTSTPHGDGSKRLAGRNFTQSNEDDFGDLTDLCYEDVSRINSLESINSEDTFKNYTKLSGMVRNSKLKKKNGGEYKQQNRTTTSPKDVIVLDETINDSTIRLMEKEEENENVDQGMDDSVIFISETVGKSNKPAPMLDFVPLDSDDVPNPINVPMTPPRPPRKAAVRSGLLFTNSEKKELLAYNNNTYNPNAGDPNAIEHKSNKRLILIDGCNVAFNHALNREFSVKGLKICIDYFEKMGHEVKAVVPQFRMHRCSDPSAMCELHSGGKIVVTPCKNLPGKCTASYDDRFVLQLAAEMDAAIVSNDNYRDLINENSAFKKLIENRVLGFTWCNDLFMVAKDPYGKWGPALQTILNRT